MFNYIPSNKNKQQKQSRVSYKDYINTSSRIYKIPGLLPADLQTEMKGSISDMRRQFRHTAKRIRELYSGV